MTWCSRMNLREAMVCDLCVMYLWSRCVLSIVQRDQISEYLMSMGSRWELCGSCLGAVCDLDVSCVLA